MREKVDPYLRPMYDALYDLMDRALVERALQSGEIEIAPLAFMRGRTLAHAAIILDEAQNTTPMQMKMFLTRLGEHSHMIVTGDPSQIDLPPGQRSGLVEATALLSGVEDIAQIQFTGADVVRTNSWAVSSRLRQGGRSEEKGKEQLSFSIDISAESEGWSRVPDLESHVRRAAEAAMLDSDAPPPKSRSCFRTTSIFAN